MGRAKSRLAGDPGEVWARELGVAFYRDVLGTTRQMKNIRTVITTVSPGIDWMSSLKGGRFEKQGLGRLGQRLPRVLSRALKDSTFAMAVGADSRELRVEHLIMSLRSREDADAVVSRVQDDGYWQLGDGEGGNVDLTRVPMGSRYAFEDTVKAIKQSGFS